MIVDIAGIKNHRLVLNKGGLPASTLRVAMNFPEIVEATSSAESFDAWIGKMFEVFEMEQPTGQKMKNLRRNIGGKYMEAREGTLDISGEAREVDFLRIGRVVLAYQTRDKDETGFWNTNSGQWESLPAEYREAITAGLRIARKQKAPNLLKMPVPGPQETVR